MERYAFFVEAMKLWTHSYPAHPKNGDVYIIDLQVLPPTNVMPCSRIKASR